MRSSSIAALLLLVGCAEAGYVWLPNSAGCAGYDPITSASECLTAANSLGYGYSVSGMGNEARSGVWPWMSPGCAIAETYTGSGTWTKAYFNTGSGSLGDTRFRSVCSTTAVSSSSAVGDPHLQNIHGERFDLMKEGSHVLINIPRGVITEKALLHVQAEARRLGGHCADMYFQELNVSGLWAEANQPGGYHFSVSQREIKTPEWVALGKVELKVVHGHTDGGLRYLNMYVKHLGRAGFAVGGLLGEDDHEDVVIPSGACVKMMSLADVSQDPSGGSYAVASSA
jgi:hypothetical protein